jgi:hypothetical protein
MRPPDITNLCQIKSELIHLMRIFAPPGLATYCLSHTSTFSYFLP